MNTIDSRHMLGALFQLTYAFSTQDPHGNAIVYLYGWNQNGSKYYWL